jgi:hypothetical protein
MTRLTGFTGFTGLNAWADAIRPYKIDTPSTLTRRDATVRTRRSGSLQRIIGGILGLQFRGNMV